MGRKKLGKERADITLPKGMKEEAANAAADEGKTLSDLVADLLRRHLDARKAAREPAKK